MNAPASNKTRVEAIARQWLQQHPVYLDTETTGLNSTDEIVEISVMNDDGCVLFESFVKPRQPIPASTTAIHGITNTMVQSAQSWPVVWMQVRDALFGRLVAIYNDDFDLRMMRQSHARYQLPWKETIKTIDIMKLYAEYRGEWDSIRRSYRWFSLENAGKQCRISLPNSHRASDDALLTRALLHFMAGEPQPGATE
jgi:DNA polymerase III subunit epsilon